MKIRYLLLASIASVLIACAEKPAPPATEHETVDPSCARIMTNDEIITETNKCNQAGLDAEALHCGDDMQTVIIQCKPRLTTVSAEE
jgi:hypothetical protein